MTAAIAILIAARRLDLRFVCSSLAAAFCGLHAATHLFLSISGRAGHLLDLSTTYLPFLILTWEALSSRRNQSRGRVPRR